MALAHLAHIIQRLYFSSSLFKVRLAFSHLAETSLTPILALSKLLPIATHSRRTLVATAHHPHLGSSLLSSSFPPACSGYLLHLARPSMKDLCQNLFGRLKLQESGLTVIWAQWAWSRVYVAT